MTVPPSRPIGVARRVFCAGILLVALACKAGSAFVWTAYMDVDCDGVRTSKCNEKTDCCFQNQTSFETSKGRPFQADLTHYFVIPLPSSRFSYTKAGIRPGTTAAILECMKRVTSTSKGTAYYAFRDEKLPIAAKTGSAENENPDAHAWFVGFTPPDRPSLLVLVMIEGGQHGGTVAAPVARTLIDMAVRR